VRKKLRLTKKRWNRILEIDRKSAAYDRDSVGQTLRPCRSGDCWHDAFRSDWRGLTDCKRCKNFFYPNPKEYIPTWGMILGITPYAFAGIWPAFHSFPRLCIGPNG
jgi:hypothetical protein